MKLFKTVLTAIFLVAAVFPVSGYSHCEIPCGIYHDELRFELMDEMLTTIEKSMSEITELSGDGDKNYNQIVRWITNKEEHATKFQTIVTQYFMTQRVKTVTSGADGYEEYVQKITLLHGMIRSAMKCKQTTDLTNVETLRAELASFQELYLAEHNHK